MPGSAHSIRLALGVMTVLLFLGLGGMQLGTNQTLAYALFAGAALRFSLLVAQVRAQHKRSLAAREEAQED